MRDLIERDKAIANMRKNHDVNLGTLPTGNRSYEDIWHCVAIAYDEGIEYAIKVLNGMPSAQPEIIRCKDCKHNPKDEWFGCPMSHLSEKQRPETAWCWRGEKKDG